MNNINVSIVNTNKLRLNEDAQEGDLIDLEKVVNLDIFKINKRVTEGKDTVYNDRLQEVKQEWDNQNKILQEKAILEATQSLQEENTALKTEKNNFQTQLDNVRQTVQAQAELEKTKAHESLTNEIFLLKSQIKAQSIQLKKEFEIDKIQAINEIKKGMQKRIDKLERRRFSYTPIQQGANFENSCSDDVHNLVFSRDDLTWEKDNEAISGHQANFIYKVYADSQQSDPVLTSAMLEMKTEDMYTVNKQKNNKHYEQLDKNRKNKNLEYALLVSELKYETEHDLPIKKIPGFEKMYLVRPAYLTIFLNCITDLAKKYQEKLVHIEREKEKFKNVGEIKREFQDMKDSIIDNSLKHIEGKVHEIIQANNAIVKSTYKISDCTSIIIEKHLNTVKTS